LTDEAIRSYDTAAKVNPPLRTKSDQQAIIKALKIGIIDVIATDHAPHTEEDKNVEFNLAATGLVGLETALALVLTRLVAKKTLTLKQLVERMSSNPAKILRFSHKGTLKPGSDADVIIVDPKAEWVVDEKKFASKGRNTPFKGWKLTGKVVHTIVGGSIVVKDGKLT